MFSKDKSMSWNLPLLITERLNTSFPFYLNDERKNTLLILVISIFLFFFLSGVHIDHMPAKLNKIALVSGSSFVVLFANIILLPRLFPVLFDTLNWTLGKYLLFNAWQFLFIGAISSLLLYLLDFYPGLSLTEIALSFYPRLIMYGIVPVTIVTLFLNNKLLQDNLRNAIKANQELDRIRILKVEQSTLPGLLTIYSDTSETLSLKLPDLLFIEADDNYSTFYWMNGHGLEKKMLRVNLKNVESQLNNSFTLRCHRSFIVNINKIGHVSGNTNGYKLNIKNTDLSVPVSRAKGKLIIEKIEQLRNMIELN